ncbi:MAG: glycosyltransferase family 4 protein [Candidatus Pacebacteria bacterium]|nr:glycosyltransferase family 4 protein [Candidatus Paceibacterota bacterium]
MKIGMFINYYTPSKGGMETSVINLSKGLKKAGHEVFIFAPKYPNYKDEDENIFRYRSIRFNYGGYFYVIPVPFGSKMKEIVKELKLDIIHSHQPYSLGSEAMKFSKELSIPLVFTYHIKYEDYSHYIPLVPSSISKKYIRKITVGYSNKCDAVISPSTAIKRLIENHGVAASVKIIPSGINIDNFQNDTGKKKEIREKYRVKQDEIMLITACRLTKEKNLEFLVRSFVKITQKEKNIKFMIVGDGAVKKDLEKMAEDLGIKEKVIFTGLVDRTEIVSLYQASDIFVFASKTETQGLVAVEAMAAGCPVVAVKASGIEDIVKDGEDGFLTSSSEEDFAEKVLQIVNNEELRKKMAEKAKENSRKFEIAPWVDKIMKLYESLI